MPTRVSFDPRVERSARFSEHLQLQLLWEAFNVLNHGNITGVKYDSIRCQFVRKPSLTLRTNAT